MGGLKWERETAETAYWETYWIWRKLELGEDHQYLLELKKEQQKPVFAFEGRICMLIAVILTRLK